MAVGSGVFDGVFAISNCGRFSGPIRRNSTRVLKSTSRSSKQQDTRVSFHSDHRSCPHAAKNFSYLNATRTRVPSPYTTVAYEHADGSEDSIVFTFSRSAISVDDISAAMLLSFFAALQELSRASGDQNAAVTSDKFTLADTWFDFSVETDDEAPLDGFRLWHLRTVIAAIFTLGREFDLREMRFQYMSQGAPLLVGHLQNPAVRAPPRRPTPEGLHDVDALGDTISFLQSGPPMSYDVIAQGLMDILDQGWDRMVEAEADYDSITLPRGRYHYTYERFMVFDFAARRGPTNISLKHLLVLVRELARYGREYFLKKTAFWLVAPGRVDAAGWIGPAGSGPPTRGEVRAGLTLTLSESGLGLSGTDPNVATS